MGQDRRRRGARVLPRAGAGAPRRRRRPLHPRDVPRSERDRRGDRRGAQPLGSADRRADDDGGRRQHARRHAAGALRAGAREARRDDPRRELRGRAGADARHDRADRGGDAAQAVGAAQRRQAARRRGPQHLSLLAGVHGLVRAALHPAQRPPRRRLLRDDAGSHPADQVPSKPGAIGGAGRRRRRLSSGMNVRRAAPGSTAQRFNDPRSPAGKIAAGPGAGRTLRHRRRSRGPARRRVRRRDRTGARAEGPRRRCDQHRRRTADERPHQRAVAGGADRAARGHRNHPALRMSRSEPDRHSVRFAGRACDGASQPDAHHGRPGARGRLSRRDRGVRRRFNRPDQPRVAPQSWLRSRRSADRRAGAISHRRLGQSHGAESRR